MTDANDLMQQMMTGYGVSAPSPDELDRIIKEDEEKKVRIAAEKKRAEDEARAAEERARIAAERQAAAERARQEAAERCGQQQREEQARIEMERLAQEEKKRLAAEKASEQEKSKAAVKPKPSFEKEKESDQSNRPVKIKPLQDSKPTSPNNKIPIFKHGRHDSSDLKRANTVREGQWINPNTAQGKDLIKRMLNFLEDNGQLDQYMKAPKPSKEFLNKLKTISSWERQTDLSILRISYEVDDEQKIEVRTLFNFHAKRIEMTKICDQVSSLALLPFSQFDNHQEIITAHEKLAPDNKTLKPLAEYLPKHVGLKTSSKLRPERPPSSG